jgi:four helix bundle protein
MIRDFRDLLAWQLAQALRDEVSAFLETGAASRDFKFRDQLSDASASGPRNIAEGFGRVRPREFANFLRIARGSLFEVQHHLEDASRRGYLASPLRDRLMNLSRAAIRVTTGLMRAKERQANAERQTRSR